MKRWQLIILASVCFGMGALSATVYQGVAQGGPSMRRGSLYSGLAERLALTPDQEFRLDEIVEEARHRMVDLSRETKPRFREIKRETRDHIRGILNVEQLTTFNTICDSCDRRKRSRR
jgi:hypothetical protein